MGPFTAPPLCGARPHRPCPREPHREDEEDEHDVTCHPAVSRTGDEDLTGACDVPPLDNQEAH